MDDYALYIGANEPKGKFEFSYWSYKTRYFLVLSNKAPDGMQRVPTARYERLGDDERQWLVRSLVAVNKRRIQDNKDIYLQMLERFVDLLDKELEKEKEKSVHGEEKTDN